MYIEYMRVKEIRNITLDYFSGGFFTMQHDVEDISPQVHKIYNLVDPVALEIMITEVRLNAYLAHHVHIDSFSP